MGQVTQSARRISLRTPSILDYGVTVVENTAEEPCLLNNPNVAGSFDLKFYAGAALTTSDGIRIGTLCIMDKPPQKSKLAKVKAKTLSDLKSRPNRFFFEFFQTNYHYWGWIYG